MKKILSLILSLLLILCFVPRGSANTENETAILSVNTAAEIAVNAKAYILMDRNTGTVIAAKNENEQLYPASVTKIMTLLLVAEAIECGKLTLEMEITCSESAAEKGGSQIWLEPGEIMCVDDLLKAAVVYSANDACCLLGECVAGDETAFCVMMNERAAQLGMKNTNFDNCTGLDDDTDTHKTTAYDIALMSRELLKHDIIRNYTSIWMDTLRNGETQIVNTNKLMRTYHGATGLKTGTTSKAGCCVSASAQRDGLELIAVVLGADNSKDRFSGAAALLDWGFANYEIMTLETQGTYPEKIKLNHGTKEEAEVIAEKPPEILVNKGIGADVTVETVIPESIDAPVEKGQEIGELIFRHKDTVLAESKLMINEDTEKMDIPNGIKALFNSMRKNKI
ncbi:MAG: D-alanyl-D-alanine carboxypeptidase [Ruminococcaceae bacterium]|nr:D-alanyl-D-alanine carboxypeptidase [Oscillospiraceae bacterium]MBR3597200.1 D-alanyl-D-alanine carboxypeptidase [Clostridia bacterium]